MPERRQRPRHPVEPEERHSADRPDRQRARIGAAGAAARAAAQVQALTGRSPEGVTALERTEEGWQVGVEVLETRRIPDSTDILAVYQVALDQDGELVSYRRTSRYYRGRTHGEEEP